MTAPAFFNKQGWLTAYAISCGYVQSQDDGAIRLSSNGCCYDIYMSKTSQYWNARNNGRGWGGAMHGEHANGAWLSFDTLTEARNAMRFLMRGQMKRRFESKPDVAREVFC